MKIPKGQTPINILSRMAASGRLPNADDMKLAEKCKEIEATGKATYYCQHIQRRHQLWLARQGPR